MSEVRLSVVVTIVDGGATLERCLDGLADQVDGPTMEVLVPYDASIAETAGLVDRYPDFRFLDLGPMETERPIESHGGQHELFDRRRSGGLTEARGELVGILEDRGVPDPSWARTMDRLHAAPHAVIGGAVECGIDETLNWAVFFCDFGRYSPPLEAGPREYVTDVNITYKRKALESTRELWESRYHETTVNWAIARSGETLFLSPEPLIRQYRDQLTVGGVVRERIDWGRLFAYTRVREVGIGKRAVFTLLSPVLPVVLLLRHGRMQMQKGRLGRFIKASPYVLLLLAAWSLGEFRGYLTGKP